MNIQIPIFVSQIFDRDSIRILMAGVASGIPAAAIFLGLWWVGVNLPRLSQGAGLVFRVFIVLDRWVVRIGSFLVGTRFPAWPRRTWLVSVAAGVAVGLFSPNPTVVRVSLGIGLAFLYVVLRHWSYDENERFNPTSQSSKLMSGERDLRFDAALSVVLVFVIAPMGLSKLNQSGSALLSTLDFVNQYAGYTWFEFPHSIPVFHALGIFFEKNPFMNVDSVRMLKAATFLLRLIYELFVVSAIVKLTIVGQRIARLEDLRPIEKGLKSGDKVLGRQAMDALGKLASRQHRAALEKLVEIASGRSNYGPPDYATELRMLARKAFYIAESEFLKSVGDILSAYEMRQREIESVANSIAKDGDVRPLDKNERIAA